MIGLSSVASIFLILLAVQPAVGQPGRPNTFGSSGNQASDGLLHSPEYVAKTFTVEDGLPQNVVRSVAQGGDGSLWIGTFSGLARYDGHSFERFDAVEIDGLVSNRVTALHQAPDGALWIGTETGLSVRQNGQFRRIPAFSYVPQIKGGAGGTVWIRAEDQKRLYRSAPGGVRAVPLPDTLKDEGVGGFAPAGRDSVWVRVGRDLFLWTGSRFTRPSRINEIVGPLTDPIDIEAAPNGQLWIATPSNVLSIQDQTVRRYPLDKQVGEMSIGPSGAPWIVTMENGFFRLAGEALRRVEAEGTLSKRLYEFTRDASGQWWVGTRDGLVRLRPRLFEAVATGVPDRPPARGIYAGEGGTVWISLARAGILEMSGNRRVRWTEADGLPRSTTWTVGKDRTGALAVGTGEGLAWLEKGRFEGDPRFESTVTAIHRDSTGTLWMGSRNGTLYQLPAGERTQVVSSSQLGARVNALYRDRSGTLWVGTRSKGLARLESDPIRTGDSLTWSDSVTWYDTDDGLPYISIRDVYETDDGILWVSTYGGGVARFEGRSAGGAAFTSVTPDDGLPAGTISAIHEAPDGIFWMTSNEGVFRVPRKQLAAVADGARDRVYPRVFGSEDGMPDRECNGPFAPSIAEDPQGRLWIPTMEGPTVVDPSRKAFHVPASVPVRITEVRADGVPAPLDSLRLAPSTYRIAIDFTGVSLRYGEDLSFRYRLDGGKWRPARSRRTVEYTGLSPGTHRFEVQATVQGETWHALDRPLTITIRPHFYQTWWFRFAVGAWVIIIGFAIYRFRTYRLRRRQKELEETVAERTRELRNQKQRLAERKERLTDQINTLKGAMARVEAGDLGVEVDAQRKDELGELARSFNQMVSDLRERSLLQRHVGEHTLEMVRSTDDVGATQLGEGRIREVAILFTDIRGSTERIERTDPESFVQQLNRTFNRQAETANRFGGSIDKFVGDAMIALFTGEKALRRALRCSIDIQCGFQDDSVSSSFFNGLGIGVNYGPVLMGNLGGEERLDYSVIGTEVNLCARLCSAADPDQILVRGDLIEHHGLSDEVRINPVDERRFKGFDHRFRVAEVLYDCEGP